MREGWSSFWEEVGVYEYEVYSTPTHLGQQDSMCEVGQTEAGFTKFLVFDIIISFGVLEGGSR